MTASRRSTFRVVPMGPRRLLQALIEDRWQPVYSIAPEPCLDSHFELANWYSSTHPASHFRHRLIVTRSTPETRYVLVEGRLTIRWSDGSSDRRYLDEDGIMRAFKDIFQLPVEAEWRKLAEQAAKATEAERLAEAA